MARELNADEKELPGPLRRKFSDDKKSHAEKVQLTLHYAISVHSHQHTK